MLHGMLSQTLEQKGSRVAAVRFACVRTLGSSALSEASWCGPCDAAQDFWGSVP